MSNTIRERLEKLERATLSEQAAFSDSAGERERAEEKCEIRTEFQRDRDRIIHSSAFRRLKHKTQVFLSPEGDHYRTRLTHTLEVSQIARTIARALRLNEDLTEAIALGHDLGHTPFGHAGERALDKLNPTGFKHYEQSVRVAKVIEKGGNGLNLTPETLDGFYCHTKGDEAYTLEGRIVRVADKIAYMNHDIDDAIRASVITGDDIPLDVQKQFGGNKSERINSMVNSIILNSDTTIKMAEADQEMFDKLHAFLFEAVYFDQKAKLEEKKVDGIIEGLYRHFANNPEKLPKVYKEILEKDGLHTAVSDYIAGMTDTFAVRVFEEVYIPKAWTLL